MTPAIRPAPGRQATDGPPPWLPLAFLAQASLWLWLGAIAMVVVAPDLALGLTAMPRTFAATHLFTLGVLGAATIGALHRFVPVVTGVGLNPPRRRLGLLGARPRWRPWSPPVVVVPARAAGRLDPAFLAVGLGSWNILPARRRARPERLRCRLCLPGALRAGIGNARRPGADRGRPRVVDHLA
jgi:hypothetical protein